MRRRALPQHSLPPSPVPVYSRFIGDLLRVDGGRLWNGCLLLAAQFNPYRQWTVFQYFSGSLMASTVLYQYYDNYRHQGNGF